jgi:hypothetical protein
MRRPTSLLPWLVLLLLGCIASAQNTALPKSLSCDDNGNLCTEVHDSIGYGGTYTGHDEPSILFYSNVPGSGNSSIYQLRLPKDPPTLPKQNGTGGTFNFQLHPAFWFGMALCDDQSAPNPTPVGVSSPFPNIPCKPDSDSNIYDGSDATATDYMGKHPGTAFMEMQFYPPGWVLWPSGNSCDATRWCAALNIDSLSENMNTGQFNNSVCEAAAGDEYVNFAFLTKSGVAHAPASPLLATLDTYTPNPNTDLFMNSGDKLVVKLQDTPNGFQVVINDLTTGQTGSMTASPANGFGEVLFDPSGTNCDPSTHNLPTKFHPVYATSSEHTRVPWAAHSYNIAFSDEIGHFEYCNAVSQEGGSCTQDGVHDLDAGAEDDVACFDAAASSRIQIGGCLGTDFDFDSLLYQNTWPGTSMNAKLDKSVHAQPIKFTSPVFKDREGESRNYSRVAFETDLPRIESPDASSNNNCQRHISNPADPNPGQGCVNPPVGASFYPFFTTTAGEGENCMWQEGGANIPGTINNFGGSSTTEFGSLLALAYPAANGSPSVRYNDFRRVLTINPCPKGD